jgi:hypothetical protein
MCLSEDQNLTRQLGVWTRHMQLAQRLLRAFDARVRTLDSHLRELTEHIDSTREVWHMQLDAMRNTIIRTNLQLQFVGVSTMAATLPGGTHMTRLQMNENGRLVQTSTVSYKQCCIVLQKNIGAVVQCLQNTTLLLTRLCFRCYKEIRTHPVVCSTFWHEFVIWDGGCGGAVLAGELV